MNALRSFTPTISSSDSQYSQSVSCFLPVIPSSTLFIRLPSSCFISLRPFADQNRAHANGYSLISHLTRLDHWLFTTNTRELAYLNCAALYILWTTINNHSLDGSLGVSCRVSCSFFSRCSIGSDTLIQPLELGCFSYVCLTISCFPWIYERSGIPTCDMIYWSMVLGESQLHVDFLYDFLCCAGLSLKNGPVVHSSQSPHTSYGIASWILHH